MAAFSSAGGSGEPVEEAAHRRRRVTVTESPLFSLYDLSQELHVVVILFVADGREETLVELRHKAVALADGEYGSAGGDGLALLGDGEFQQSRLAGGVNYLHDLLSPSVWLPRAHSGPMEIRYLNYLSNRISIQN